MNDLLDFTRKLLVPSSCYYDETTSQFKTFTDSEKESGFAVVQQIYSEIHDLQQKVKERFIVLGRYLYELEKGNFYIYVLDKGNSAGYNSFYKFCSECLGFKKRTVANLLLVYKTYFLNAIEFDRIRYEKYSFRQLVEMVSLGKNRDRVNETVSTRNIRKLAELYKEYTPRPEDTISHDLEIWRDKHERELKEKSDKKDSLFFIPNKNANENNYDSEEGSIMSTPSDGLNFEDIRRGLNGLFDRLIKVSPLWQKAVDIFKEALDTKTPLKVCSHKEKTEAVLKEMERRAKDPRIPRQLPPAERLNLKNKAEREAFLKSCDTWNIWFEIPEFEMIVRRKDFINGDYIIAMYGNRYWLSSDEPDKLHSFHDFHLVTNKRNKFNFLSDSITSLLDYLTKNKDKI